MNAVKLMRYNQVQLVFLIQGVMDLHCVDKIESIKYDTITL